VVKLIYRSLAEAIVALQNCHAQLVVGGTLRVAVPDVNWDLGRAAETNPTACDGRSSLFTTTLATAALCPRHTMTMTDSQVPAEDSGSPPKDSGAVWRALFAKDARALHCVQYTRAHLLGMARSVFAVATAVEYTDDCGQFRGFGALYDSDNVSASWGPDSSDGVRYSDRRVHVLDHGFIQRSSFGDKAELSRSIIVDMVK